jgi:hypothetical protein
VTTDGPIKTHLVRVAVPEGTNVIFGQAHFIKTVEDMYEALVASAPTLSFGIAFCEASGKRLVRTDGNNPKLIERAQSAAFDVACGHTFFVYLENGFPINVLNRIKALDEVCLESGCAPGAEFGEMPQEQGRYIAGSLAQRRQSDGHAVEASQEILSKLPFISSFAKRLLGRDDDAHVNRNRLGLTEWLHFSLFEDTQYFRLDGERQVCHFV